MEEIVTWLEAGAQANYQDGVRLLEKHSRNRTLINHLARKESATNYDKLTYELIKVCCEGNQEHMAEVFAHLAAAQSTVAVDAQAAAAVVGAVPALEAVANPLEQLPEHVRQHIEKLTQKMAKHYNEGCQLSNKLAQASDAEGPSSVAQILQNEQEYNAMARDLKILKAGGYPAPEAMEEGPAAESPAGVDLLKLTNDRNNLRSNLSKARKKLETDPDNVEKQEKVAKLQVELDQVELQLKAAQQ